MRCGCEFGLFMAIYRLTEHFAGVACLLRADIALLGWVLDLGQ